MGFKKHCLIEQKIENKIAGKLFHIDKNKSILYARSKASLNVFKYCCTIQYNRG